MSDRRGRAGGDQDQQRTPGSGFGAEWAYGANMNLVLQADRSNIPSRRNEPTGEPETLAGRISVKDMGSRAQRDTEELKKFREENQGAQQRKEKRKQAARQGNLYVASVPRASCARLTYG